MLLTFENNKFVIRQPNEMQLYNLVEGPLKDAWLRNYADNSFRTSNINEAARFRKYADNKTENIFKKLMLKALPLPSGGLVVPEELTLMGFQEKRGIPHILKNSRSYIAHQPGLGKSAQAIVAVNTKPGKTLIICPAFLKVNWAREITKWSSNHFPEIAIVPSSDKRLEMNWKADFIICPDSMLQKPWVLKALYAIEFRFIFIDEGHRYKNAQAIRTAAIFGGSIYDKDKLRFKSPGIVYEAEHVCVLSGTPMLATPSDLWPVVYALAPEVIDFMSFKEFTNRYCISKVDRWGGVRFIGSQNEEELHMRLTNKFMQRIKKSEVLYDLPSKIRNFLPIDENIMTPEMTAEDHAAQERLEALMEASSDPDVESSMGDFAKLRRALGIAKAPWVASYVRELLDENPDEKIILFAHHRDVVDALYVRLLGFNPRLINGGVKNEDRTKIEDEFQTGPCRLIIGNIDAMNLGITLTAATRVLFAEYSWTPAMNEQAEDRAHRIGQRDSVFVEYIIAPETMDELILDTIMRKQKSIEAVIK